MKKLLIGLLALSVNSSFASDCSVMLKPTNGIQFSEEAKKIIELEKGYAIVTQNAAINADLSSYWTDIAERPYSPDVHLPFTQRKGKLYHIGLLHVESGFSYWTLGEETIPGVKDPRRKELQDQLREAKSVNEKLRIQQIISSTQFNDVLPVDGQVRAAKKMPSCHEFYFGQ